ncbi:MAG TPA: aldehyde dehydrogenase [Acidimicrobiales bacterium]|nr:aldehyde dehydrogenase [Acidimicrobiales bacterium]
MADPQLPGHPDRLYVDGNWVAPSSSDLIDVVDATTEEVFLRVAAAGNADMGRAVAAARRAFDQGPWPRRTHSARADHLRALADELRRRAADHAALWTRQAGILHRYALGGAPDAAARFEYYAGLADTFDFEAPATPTVGAFGLLAREPVGVVGAIIPWNAPLTMLGAKVAPALLAGCTVVLKASPEAPGEAYLLAEAAHEVGLPAGVLNVVTADRDVSESLVRDPRVDKITFTGSTAAGRRIASLCGERIARCTLELGGKSAAVVLDDADLAATARTLGNAECYLSGQVCSSLTRIIVSRDRQRDLVDALAERFARVRVGDPFDDRSHMGPLATARQRQRVEGYIAKGVADGASLVAGGGRPAELDRGWFVQPTLFADVDNRSTIAQEEIFGPVLAVVPADDEQHAVALANDTIYGLNASVFTPDVDRARAVAGRLRSGTVGHNAMCTDFGVAFGGYKQSGIGREGGVEGLLPFLETKFMVFDGPPSGHAGT